MFVLEVKHATDTHGHRGLRRYDRVAVCACARRLARAAVLGRGRGDILVTAIRAGFSRLAARVLGGISAHHAARDRGARGLVALSDAPCGFHRGRGRRDRLDRRDHCGPGLAAAAAALLGVAVVLAAPTGETFTNPTNVQWIMASAMPLIAATAPPAGRFSRANQVAFVALSGLSGPFSILMIPIWLWCVVSGARRDGLALVLTATTVLAGAAQAIVIVGTPETLDGPVDLLRALWGVLLRAVTEPFAANNGFQDVPDREHRASRGCGARRICPPPSRLHGVGRLAGIGGGVEVPHGAGLARCFHRRQPLFPEFPP